MLRASVAHITAGTFVHFNKIFLFVVKIDDPMWIINTVTLENLAVNR